MRWPQITMIVLMAISLGINLANDGKTRVESYNFGITLISIIIQIFILKAGGFF